MVFLRDKVAVFCDSEFWQEYDWENRKEDIKEFGDVSIETAVHIFLDINQFITFYNDDRWVFFGNCCLEYLSTDEWHCNYAKKCI